MLLTADFGRQGTDLVLVGDDGETIIVRDYFSTDSPPTRLTASGARITGDLAGKLAGPADPTQVAQAGAGGAAAAIGRVDTADGAITITRANGDEVDGTVGTPIFQGDVVETKVGGSLGIVFADETTFSLGESGRMVIDEMVYDPAGESGSASLSVVQGVFAFVSGKIAKTGIDAMTVSTPGGDDRHPRHDGQRPGSAGRRRKYDHLAPGLERCHRPDQRLDLGRGAGPERAVPKHPGGERFLAAGAAGDIAGGGGSTDLRQCRGVGDVRGSVGRCRRRRDRW